MTILALFVAPYAKLLSLLSMSIFHMFGKILRDGLLNTMAPILLSLQCLTPTDFFQCPDMEQHHPNLH